jgi:hypothetical protein
MCILFIPLHNNIICHDKQNEDFWSLKKSGISIPSPFVVSNYIVHNIMLASISTISYVVKKKNCFTFVSGHMGKVDSF